jgi:transglutaminase-like putative cysteine protease
MHIRAGFEITYTCGQATPMLLLLSVHPTRAHDLRTPHRLQFSAPVRVREFQDGFDNTCHRVVLPPGTTTISNSFVVADSGEPDLTAPFAHQHPVEELPDDVLVYLLGSRFCETETLSDTAWSLFGNMPTGWARVQAIVDYVHRHIQFGYAFARPTRTAQEAFAEGRGVCRDFAHLAVTFCRCMNIPARYCTGYLGDIGVPPDPAPMDFSAWFEVFLDGRWFVFDARHNQPRIGRVLMARGRDATDVAISTGFGPTILSGFRVITDECEPPTATRLTGECVA